MQSQSDVIAALRKLGYPVNARVITDWRAKKLLPPLIRMSGQGKAARYVWRQPEVVQQCIAVQLLFAQRKRAGSTLLNLWFAGFVVPANRARSLWLKELTKERESLLKGATTSNQYQYRLPKLVRKLANSPSIPREFGNVIRAGLDLWLDSDLSDEPDLVALRHGLKTLFRIRQFGSGYPPMEFSEGDLARHIKFLKAHISIGARESLIKTASVAELERSQRDWRISFTFWARLFSPSNQLPNLELLNAHSAFGRIFMTLDLICRSLGYGKLIDETILGLIDLLGRGISKLNIEDPSAQLILVDALQPVFDRFNLEWENVQRDDRAQ